ncbi:MAG: hypothetical protein VW713_12005, partial [Alphaproteobacteria bacterium]
MNTEIIVITDRSGSMASIAKDVIGGYNTFLKEQQAQPGEARITYTQFDDKYEVVSAGVPVKDAKELTNQTFVPRGSTALYDAIGRTLNEQGAQASIPASCWSPLHDRHHRSRTVCGKTIGETGWHAIEESQTTTVIGGRSRLPSAAAIGPMGSIWTPGRSSTRGATSMSWSGTGGSALTCHPSSG